MKDLSKIDGTMTSILIKHDDWKSLESPIEVYNYVYNIFKDNEINTPASRRLLSNLKSKKTLQCSLLSVYNSILSGCNLSVDRK